MDQELMSDEPTKDLEAVVPKNEELEAEIEKSMQANFGVAKDKEVENSSKERDFKKAFNITSEDLETIPYFNELSEGQKALVFDNLRQLTLARIEEEAYDKNKQEMAESNFLVRLWRGAMKKSFIAEQERSTAQEIKTGGIEAHRGVLVNLVNLIKDNGPEAEVKNGGQVEILFGGKAGDYAQNNIELNNEDKAKLANFNSLATKFSKLPYEWSLAKASPKQQKEFKELKQSYEQALADILNLKKTKLGNETAAALAVKDIDYAVQRERFFNTNPEVEKRLKEIDSQTFWNKAWRSSIAERATYMGGGFVGRTALAGALGIYAAPVVAAISGARMAWRRAKEDIKETEANLRRGGKIDSQQTLKIKEKISLNKEKLIKAKDLLEVKKLLHNIVDDEAEDSKLPKEIRELKADIMEAIDESSRLNADLYEQQLKQGDKAFITTESAVEKLNRLIDKFNNTGEEAGKEEVRGLLRARIFYVKDKIDSGLVNFGAGEKSLSSKYNLLKVLSQAEALMMAGNSKLLKDKEGVTLEERLKKFTNFRQGKIDSKEFWRVVKKVTYGASLGAGFAYLGGLLRGGIGNLFGGSKQTAAEQIVSQVKLSGSSPELLAQGQAIDSLSRKLGLEIPDLSQSGPQKVGDYLRHLQELDRSFSSAGLKGTAAHDFISEHQEMFAGQKVPSAEEISAHLAKESAITTVAEGQGIETKGIQQIIDDPRKFGYAGDLQDIKGVKSFAGKLAHEAALNTQVGDKAVAGVNASGQAYDLRLKSGAIGDKVLLEQGSDGKWQYKFDEDLAKEDLYQHVARAQEVVSRGIRTDTLDWWDKSGKPGTLTKFDMTDLGGRGSGIDVYGFKGDDSSLGVLFTDSATHELLPYSVDGSGAQTAEELFKQASEAYQSLNHTVEQVTAAASEAGKGWSIADKVLVAEWSNPTGVHDKIDMIGRHILSEVNGDKVKTLVSHIGQRAPEFLKDRDFGNYLSDQGAVEHLTPERAGSLWDIGGKIKAAGFKAVDYHFINKVYSGSFEDAAWSVRGDNFVSSVKSPFTSEPIELKIADRSSFNEAFYLENKQLASRVFLNEKIVFNQLSHDFAPEQAKELMAMDVKDFKLSTLAERLGKRSWLFFNNNSTIENWYQDIEPRLSGATSGSVGEKLQHYIIGHKGVVEDWKFKGGSVPIEQTSANKAASVVDASKQTGAEYMAAKNEALEALQKAEKLEARLRAQDAIERAEKLLKKK